MKLKLGLACLCLAIGIFLVSPGFGATTEPSPPQVLGEFEIDQWGEWLCIPATWKGKEGFFVVDTGASLTVVDSTDFSALEPVQRDVNVATTGGSRKIELCHPPDLRVGPFALAELGPVFRIDMSDMRARCGKNVLGLLGAPALKHSVLQIDFDARKFRFLQPDDQPHLDWGKSLPMQLGAGQTPAVRLTIDGNALSFEIDTGADVFLNLPTKAFDHLRDVSEHPVMSVPNLTANGNVSLRELRAPDIELAGMHYRDLLYGETLHDTGALGTDFLERHLATIDLPGNRLYLKPGKEFERHSDQNMSGIRPVRWANKLIAKFIDPGSPAYQAGLREGDTLLSINGKAASDYTMADVREIMRTGDGKEMEVNYERDHKEYTVKFKLRRAI